MGQSHRKEVLLTCRFLPVADAIRAEPIALGNRREGRVQAFQMPGAASLAAVAEEDGVALQVMPRFSTRHARDLQSLLLTLTAKPAEALNAQNSDSPVFCRLRETIRKTESFHSPHIGQNIVSFGRHVGARNKY